MHFRRCLWILLAAGHLVVVVCGACHFLPNRSTEPVTQTVWPNGNLGPVAQTVQWYATMSGADSSFGFFAPSVGAPHRARILLQDDEGSTWRDVFDHANNPEARLRLSGITESAFMSGAAEEWPEWRKRLVRSWAAAMFRRHTSAVSLTVIVEAYVVPTLADYRAGSRPSWQIVYQAELQRNSPAVKTRSEK